MLVINFIYLLISHVVIDSLSVSYICAYKHAAKIETLLSSKSWERVRCATWLSIKQKIAAYDNAYKWLLKEEMLNGESSTQCTHVYRLEILNA